MHKLLASVAIGLITLSTAGCIVEGPSSRYWIENNSDITIVVRQPTKAGYLSVSEVNGHQKVEVTHMMAKGGCLVGLEIIDPKGKRLRSIDKICDGDTIVSP
jgi:hypothetical protein